MLYSATRTVQYSAASSMAAPLPYMLSSSSSPSQKLFHTNGRNRQSVCEAAGWTAPGPIWCPGQAPGGTWFYVTRGPDCFDSSVWHYRQTCCTNPFGSFETVSQGPPGGTRPNTDIWLSFISLISFISFISLISFIANGKQSVE